MIGWILLAGYWVGWLLTLRVAAWVISNEFTYREEPDGVDLFGGLFFGAFISLAWPVVVPGYIAYQRGWLTGGSRALIRPPRHIRQEVERQERERELQKRERRIAELEQSTGIVRPGGVSAPPPAPLSAEESGRWWSEVLIGKLEDAQRSRGAPR